VVAPAWPAAPAADVPGVQKWTVEGGELVVTVNARQADGATPGIKVLLAAAGVPEDQLSRVRVVREAAAALQVVRQLCDAGLTGQRFEQFGMLPQQYAPPFDIGTVFGQVAGLLVKEEILFEAADFQCGIEKLADAFTGHDSFLHQPQFEEGK